MGTYLADYLNGLSGEEETEIIAALRARALPTPTAGDLVYVNGDGDWVVLPKASNGQILTLTSGLPKWEDAPASGGWTQIGSPIVISSPQTSVVISSIPDTYRNLKLVWSGLSHNHESNAQINLNISPDGTTYDTAGFGLSPSTFSASNTVEGVMIFYDYSDDRCLAIGGYTTNGDNPTAAMRDGGIKAIRASGGISALRITGSSGSLDAGTLTLFGEP
jgi:hypothetical protein